MCHRKLTCTAFEFWQKELEAHKSATKGGAFKLGMHPKAVFDANPYATDKPLPPIKKTGTPKREVKPFKPSHPAKDVRIAMPLHAFVTCVILLVCKFVLH